MTGPSQAEPRSFGEYDNVVQIATCNLPAAEGIEEEMTGRLLHMNPALNNSKLTSAQNDGMWNVHTTLTESASMTDHETLDPDIANPMSAPCSSGVYCSEFFITVTTINGNVHSFVVDCDVWTFYVEYCDGGGGIPYDPPPGGGGGGSGPPGGDGSHVDDPCYIDPDGPAQLPHPFCPNPCEWMAPPVGWVCGDSCQTNDAIIDDINVQAAMHEAWKASYGSEINTLPPGQRKEAFIGIFDDNGSITTLNFEAQDVSSCHMSNVDFTLSLSQAHNLITLVHVHPFTPGNIIEDQRCLDARNYPQGSKYSSEPSLYDYQALNYINGLFDSYNLDLIPMIVIDSESINSIVQNVVVGNPNDIIIKTDFETIIMNRCGF